MSCQKGKGCPLVPAVADRGCILVQALHSPHLTSTLMGDNCIMGATKAAQNKCNMQSLAKCFSTSSFSVRCHHKIEKSKDIQCGWRTNQQQMLHTSISDHGFGQAPSTCQCGQLHGNSTGRVCDHSAGHTKQAQAVSDQHAHTTTANFDQRYKQMSVAFQRPIQTMFDNHTAPINSMCMKKQTEKLSWHQPLGHPWNKHLHNVLKATDFHIHDIGTGHLSCMCLCKANQSWETTNCRDTETETIN